jgi:hypothetical protein
MYIQITYASHIQCICMYTCQRQSAHCMEACAQVPTQVGRRAGNRAWSRHRPQPGCTFGAVSLSRVSQKHKRDTRHSETRHREARHTERLTDTEPTDACIRILTLLPDTRIGNQQTHTQRHTHKARAHTPSVLPWTRVDTDIQRDTPLRIHSIRPGPRPAQHGREKKERKEKK